MPKGVAHSYEFRLAMMRLHEQGQTFTALSQQCQVPRAVLGRWWKRYQVDGPRGLTPRSAASPAFTAADLGRDEAGDFAVASTEAGPGSDRTARPDECQHRLPGARGGRAESLDPARAARRPAV